MKATTEMEIKVSGGRVLEAIVTPDGACKLTVEVDDVSTSNDDTFALVEASKLSLDDEFMSYKPTTESEKKFKKLLTKAIKKGLKDFYRPVLDPSLDVYGGICYEQGRTPAVGKTYNWWNMLAKEFIPERGSRLGTRTEYVAFLGVLIKSLVANGWGIVEAWNAVCNDSKELGHYCNSENAKVNFERTGSREICGFFDLANTYKVLAEGEEAGDFWLAGGCFKYHSVDGPLAHLGHCFDRSNYGNRSVGWLVLEK